MCRAGYAVARMFPWWLRPFAIVPACDDSYQRVFRVLPVVPYLPVAKAGDLKTHFFEEEVPLSVSGKGVFTCMMGHGVALENP